MSHKLLDDLPLEDQPYNLDNHGPIFILGCPRSGTTFLSKCIAAIDNVEEFVGVLAPPRVMHLVGYFYESHAPNLEHLMLSIRDIFWQAFWRRRLFRGERLTQAFYGNKAWYDLFRAGSLKNAFMCYKEPFLCFAAEAFAKHYPNAKFLHIIRDGRDNADSMLRSYPDALSDKVLQNNLLANNKISEIGLFQEFEEFVTPWWVKDHEKEFFNRATQFERYILMWREMVSRAIRIEQQAPLRYLEIKYEDFVTSPIKQSERILSFLNFKINNRTKKRLRGAFSSSVGISRNNQDPKKLESANKLAGDLLDMLGYRL